MNFRTQYEYASERDVYDGLPIEAQDAICRIVRAERRISDAAHAILRLRRNSEQDQVRHIAAQLQDAESALDGAKEDFNEFVIPHLPEGMR